MVVIEIDPEKVAMLTSKQSPIEDDEIEDYLQNKPLNLRAILNKQEAYEGADYVITPSPSPSHYNTPSFGYGGYYPPKDTKQLKLTTRLCRKDFIFQDILKQPLRLMRGGWFEGEGKGLKPPTASS